MDPAVRLGLDWWKARSCHATWQTKNPTRAIGIQAIWQAVRFHEGPGGTRTCPVCQVPCTWQHAVFDCQWWQDKGLSLPGWWNAQAQHDNTTFWARGLLAHTTQTPCLRRLRIPKWSRRGCGRPKKLDTDGLVFATDASGGEFTSDPRLRRVGVSVVALRKTGDSLKAVGKLCAQVPGAQTVFRGGLYAVGLLLRFTMQGSSGLHPRLPRGSQAG